MVLSKSAINLIILIILFFLSSAWAQNNIKPGGSKASKNLQVCMENNYKAIQATPEENRVEKIYTLCQKEIAKINSNIEESYNASAKNGSTNAKSRRDNSTRALSLMLHKYNSGKTIKATSNVEEITNTDNAETSGKVNNRQKLIPYITEKPKPVIIPEDLESSSIVNKNKDEQSIQNKINNNSSSPTLPNVKSETKNEDLASVNSNNSNSSSGLAVEPEIKTNEVFIGPVNQEVSGVPSPVEQSPVVQNPDLQNKRIEDQTLPKIPFEINKENTETTTNTGIKKADVTNSENSDSAKNGEAKITAQNNDDSENKDDSIDVIHSDHEDCLAPEWVPGLDKKIIGIDGKACSAAQSGQRLSACIRFVRCQKKSDIVGQSGGVFLRQALCAPNECGDEAGQAEKCRDSNHAIYLENAKNITKKWNRKKGEGKSLIEPTKEKAKYKIKINQ